MTLHVHLKNQWRPEPVKLNNYADDCEYWRQGVSLHILRQNITDAQKETVSLPEFDGSEDLEDFQKMNTQTSLLCQSSTSSSEVTEQLLRDCLLEDSAISDVDYLIFGHRSIDLEFYSSPACRAQNALSNQKILPLSLSQCGTVAGLYCLELAYVLANQSSRGVVISLNDLGIMPARRRILRDVLVNDGGSILHVLPGGGDGLSVGNLEIVACDTKQFSIEPTHSLDLLPAFAVLIAQVQAQVGSIKNMMIVLPKYSSSFVNAAQKVLPTGPAYVFENTDGGYSGVNFAYNAMVLFENSSHQAAILLQLSETGAGAFCALQKGQ